MSQAKRIKILIFCIGISILGVTGQSPQYHQQHTWSNYPPEKQQQNYPVYHQNQRQYRAYTDHSQPIKKQDTVSPQWSDFTGPQLPQVAGNEDQFFKFSDISSTADDLFNQINLGASDPSTHHLLQQTQQPHYTITPLQNAGGVPGPVLASRPPNPPQQLSVVQQPAPVVHVQHSVSYSRSTTSGDNQQQQQTKPTASTTTTTTALPSSAPTHSTSVEPSVTPSIIPQSAHYLQAQFVNPAESLPVAGTTGSEVSQYNYHHYSTPQGFPIIPQQHAAPAPAPVPSDAELAEFQKYLEQQYKLPITPPNAPPTQSPPVDNEMTNILFPPIQKPTSYKGSKPLPFPYSMVDSFFSYVRPKPGSSGSGASYQGFNPFKTQQQKYPSSSSPFSFGSFLKYGGGKPFGPSSIKPTPPSPTASPFAYSGVTSPTNVINPYDSPHIDPSIYETLKYSSKPTGESGIKYSSNPSPVANSVHSSVSIPSTSGSLSLPFTSTQTEQFGSAPVTVQNYPAYHKEPSFPTKFSSSGKLRYPVVSQVYPTPMPNMLTVARDLLRSFMSPQKSPSSVSPVIVRPGLQQTHHLRFKRREPKPTMKMIKLSMPENAMLKNVEEKQESKH